MGFSRNGIASIQYNRRMQTKNRDGLFGKKSTFNSVLTSNQSVVKSNKKNLRKPVRTNNDWILAILLAVLKTIVIYLLF